MCIIDCLNYAEAIQAVIKSTRDIEYHSIVIITDKIQEFELIKSKKIVFYEIEKIKSKEQYSYFFIKKLNDYISTRFVLNIQWDGYVVNPKAWTDKFLEWDFIGSVWWKYHKKIGMLSKDGMDVGNSGFSLMSKRLLAILQKDQNIHYTHPCDHQICRVYRPYLETLGIKFAPAEIADRFGIEGCPAYPLRSVYKGSFGFHNLRTTKFKEKRNV